MRVKAILFRILGINGASRAERRIGNSCDGSLSLFSFSRPFSPRLHPRFLPPLEVSGRRLIETSVLGRARQNAVSKIGRHARHARPMFTRIIGRGRIAGSNGGEGAGGTEENGGGTTSLHSLEAVWETDEKGMRERERCGRGGERGCRLISSSHVHAMPAAGPASERAPYAMRRTLTRGRSQNSSTATRDSVQRALLGRRRWLTDHH